MDIEDVEHSPAGRDELLKRIEECGFFVSGNWKRPLAPLDLGNIKWTPDYERPGWALATTLGPLIPPFLEKRMRAANAAGIRLLCVVDWTCLTSKENLKLLSAVGAEVALIDEGEISSPLPLLKFLGEMQVGVDPEVRRHLAKDGLARCFFATTKDLKGKTLEWLLHFMFSQIRDFKVKRCNYHTASEELDVVIQLTASDGSYCWSHLAAPILLAEAKNWASKAGQEVISKFNTVLHVKRGVCKIGFVVSLSGFTSDARTQVLKLAVESRTFVLLEKADLERWIEAEDFDEALNELVVAAMLD